MCSSDLCSQLASPSVGVVAALLVATDNMLFVAARTARPEGIVTGLNAVAFLLFWAAIKRASKTAAAAAGGVAGLAMNFHINGAIAPIGIGLWVLYEYRAAVWLKAVVWIFVLAVSHSLFMSANSSTIFPFGQNIQPLSTTGGSV